MVEKVVIVGASGHAKVVIDAIERLSGYSIYCLLDDDPIKKDSMFFGYRVFGDVSCLENFLREDYRAIVAIGDNKIRRNKVEQVVEAGFSLMSAIHPAANLARNVEIGVGSVVMAGAVVNSDVQIGRGVIVNTSASIDHDSIIHDYVHIAPGSTLCGGVIVEEGAFVGSGATIIPNLKIGAGAVIGAGATVVADVESGSLVVGTPAVARGRV